MVKRPLYKYALIAVKPGYRYILDSENKLYASKKVALSRRDAYNEEDGGNFWQVYKVYDYTETQL